MKTFLFSLFSFSLLAAFLKPVASAEKFSDPSRLKADLERLTHLPSGTRSFSNLKALDEAADLIHASWKKMGFEVEEQKFVIENRNYKNLIVRYGPQDAPVFVIGAHYDVCVEILGQEFPGADDNGSGIAILLELSRWLATQKPKLPVRMELVAYTLEEPPYFGTEKMGSFIHAKSLHDQNQKVLGMISLETMGFYSDQKGSQTFPFSPLKWVYGDTGNFIAVVGGISDYSLARQIQKTMGGKKASVPVRMLSAPRNFFNTDWSDQRNYWHFGYSAVMLTDTALFRNPHYHKPTDKIETLDFEKMAIVTDQTADFILSLGVLK